jgi:UDP-N-acetylglucosamine 2-epimerase (non-hydrolysing)
MPVEKSQIRKETKTIKILTVVGARPNFVKVAPLVRRIQEFNEDSSHREKINHILVHTGQHYDYNLSKVFFEELSIPAPDVYLGVGSGTHAEQTAKIMLSFEKALFELNPHIVVVVGDVNSTLACALTAVKAGFPVAHIEAGLRCYDRTLPEEVNRLLTDAIADLLFAPSEDAVQNLKKENIAEERIFFVGNIMIDCLIEHEREIENSPILQKLGLTPKNYALLTLHRNKNVDEAEILKGILRAVNRLSEQISVVFPVHPRTLKRIAEFGLNDLIGPRILLVEPLGYIDFLKLLKNSKFVLTDSGGVQEETTFCGVPCLTLRETTERPITVTVGTNEVVGVEEESIIHWGQKALKDEWKKGSIPNLWDGKTSHRVLQILVQYAIKSGL